MESANDIQTPILSHMRRSADIQTDSEQLETLAKERQQLQHVLQRLHHSKEKEYKTATLNTNESTTTETAESKISMEQTLQHYFIKTSSFGSSFFQMQEEDVEEIVEDKLDRIEKNIVQLCTNVQARLDAST